MKNILFIIFLISSTFSFSQTLELKKMDKEKYVFFDHTTFKNINTLETNLKTTAPYKIFETELNSSLVFTPQNFNKNRVYPDFSTYYLKDELRKVMLEIPGLHRPIDYKAFSTETN